MLALDYKESWAPKSWCFWTVVLEKTLESPLDCNEIQPVHPKGDQSWMFIGRTDAEAEVPIFWPPNEKNWLTGKDPDAGRDWGQEEKGMTEDEMVGWHHWLNGPEFEQALGVGDGQGGLVCCSPWGCKKLVMTEQLNWTDLCYQCYCPHGELYVTQASPRGPPRPLGRSLDLFCQSHLCVFSFTSIWSWSWHTAHMPMQASWGTNLAEGPLLICLDPCG